MALLLKPQIPTVLNQTWALLLGHDCVAQREEAEELMNLLIPKLDGLQESHVPEGKLRVSQGVEGEVDGFRLLGKGMREGEDSVISRDGTPLTQPTSCQGPPGLLGSSSKKSAHPYSIMGYLSTLSFP